MVPMLETVLTIIFWNTSQVRKVRNISRPSLQGIF
jgi:hypothetical protein